MKTSISLILAIVASSISLSALAAPAQGEKVIVEQVTAKHQADKDHTYEELLIENGGDLDPDHWASQAISELIGKYCGIMVGYPDNSFRGPRQMTRFEMAAALNKLMGCMDKSINQIKAPAQPKLDHLATKADLAQLAALIKALRPELDALKANHLDLEKRVALLESIRVHGGVQIRYRDRVVVTDGTDRLSPFFAKDNVSPEQRVLEGGVVEKRQANEANPLAFNNNINQFVRDTFGLPDKYHSPAEANVTLDDLAPFRTRAWLNVEADPFDWVSAFTQLDIYDIGRASSGLSEVLVVSNGGHDLNEGLPDGSPFVFRQAHLNLHTPDRKHQLQFGLYNFAGQLNPGTGFTSLFDSGAWNGRDYGFVGWGGADVALSNTAVTPYRNSISRYWAGGLGASMVDPDAKKYNTVTAPSLTWRSDWGSGSFMFGLNGGATQSNRLQAANGNLSSGGPAVGSGTSRIPFATDALYSGAILAGLDRKGKLVGGHLALPSQFGDGYAVIGLEQSFLKEVFPLRVSLAAMHYLNDALFDFSAATRKELSGTLDLGWNQNFGATVQVNKSFIGYDRHSLGLFFNNIANSGFDVQLGANLAARGLFNLADMASANAGIAVGIPLLRASAPGRDDIRLVLGARQAFGDNFGMAREDAALNQLFKDSGLTLSIPYKNVAGSNLSLQAQYSVLLADALWQLRSVAQDFALITTYTF